MSNIKDVTIDMLNVAAADAFVLDLHYENGDKLVLVDAGYYSDGDKILDFLRTNYPNRCVNLAIVTHPDADHYEGFVRMLEKLRDQSDDAVQIEQFLINDPSQHVNVHDAKYYRNQQNFKEKVKSVYDYDKENLLDLIDELDISRSEVFADKNNDEADLYGLKILSPSTDFYESIVPDFRDGIKYFSENDEDEEDETDDYCPKDYLSKTMDEADDDSSVHNQSSIIFTFNTTKGIYLFMGDAGKRAFKNIQDVNACKNVYWLKVPHHGSKHNIDSEMINHFSPNVAYISTEKRGHYLSPCVVNALKNANVKVYSTHKHGNMLHHGSRPGYSKANPL